MRSLDKQETLNFHFHEALLDMVIAYENRSLITMATCHISISAKLIATKFDKAMACDIESPHIKAHDPLITGSYVRTQNRRCAACITLLSLNVSQLTNHKAMRFERGDFPVKNNQRNVQIIST